jgi:DNA processing protein
MILAALPGLGPVNIRKLDQSIEGGVDRLLEMDPNEQARWCPPRVLTQLADYRKFFDPASVAGELEKRNADFITFEESGYPGNLSPFADRPVGLYRVRAGVMMPERSIAIVGTRKPSTYGRRVAREFADGLSRSGFCIVSGLAEGVDTEAHRAALDAGGLTGAVLGGGLNRCYPLSNRDLMEEIEQSAGVWTEFPLWRRADRRSFPQRNRIVAGLSEGVIVIESGTTGGSMITARMASEQGKSVYVVPGRIDAPESSGCHMLIRDGAQLVTSVEEILEDLNHLPGILKAASAPCGEAGRGMRRTEPELNGKPLAIWKFFRDNGAANVDEIAGSLDIRTAEVTGLLLELELEGLISRRLDGRFEQV